MLPFQVQQNSEVLDLMMADLATGQAEPVPGARQPVDLKDPMRPTVGYYGQFGREELLEQIPEPPLGATTTGWIIGGFGEHLPVGDLPLRAGDEPNEEIKRRTLYRRSNIAAARPLQPMEGQKYSQWEPLAVEMESAATESNRPTPARTIHCY